MKADPPNPRRLVDCNFRQDSDLELLPVLLLNSSLASIERDDKCLLSSSARRTEWNSVLKQLTMSSSIKASSKCLLIKKVYLYMNTHDEQMLVNR